MKTLTELAEENGADLDVVHPLATKIIFHDEEDLQKLIDAHNKQLSEPCYQIYDVIEGFRFVDKAVYDAEINKDDKRIVYLTPQPTTEVKESIELLLADKERYNWIKNSCYLDIKTLLQIDDFTTIDFYIDQARSN